MEDPSDIAGGAGGSDRDFDRVASYFNVLDKVVRASKLYQGEGALLERMMDDLERRSAEVLAQGAVTVRVASFGLVYQGHPLAPDEKRVAYLFRMFCDGVRELTVLPGIDRPELEQLVEILSADLRNSDEDLVTMLWRKQFKCIRYYAADTFSTGMQVSMDGDLMLSSSQAPGQFAKQAEGLEVTLSPDDIRLLAGEGHLEWVKEVKAPLQATGKVAQVAGRIRSAFRTPKDVGRFVKLGLEQSAREAGEGEAAPSALILGLFDDLCQQGRAEPVATLLLALLDTSGELKPCAQALLTAVADPERLARLAPPLARQPEAFEAVLPRLVAHLGASLVPLLNELESGEVQALLHEHLAEAGHDLTSYYAARMDDPDEKVVLHAVESLGAVGTPDAIQALARVLSRNSTTLRRAALTALVGKYHPEVRVALARSLKDPDRDNRLMALRVLEKSGDSRLTWGLLSSLKDTRFGDKDDEEQAAFYRALAAFQDDRTVAHFKEILSRKNLVRSKATIKQQLLAVRALSEVGTAHAHETLKSFRKARFHPAQVRTAIEQAIARGPRSS